jgi:hypothetical protein
VPIATSAKPTAAIAKSATDVGSGTATADERASIAPLPLPAVNSIVSVSIGGKIWSHLVERFTPHNIIRRVHCAIAIVVTLHNRRRGQHAEPGFGAQIAGRRAKDALSIAGDSAPIIGDSGRVGHV